MCVCIAFTVPGVEPPCVEAAVAAHDELSDVIKTVLQQHPTINGTDILAASCNLITQIKGKSVAPLLSVFWNRIRVNGIVSYQVHSSRFMQYFIQICCVAVISGLLFQVTTAG